MNKTGIEYLDFSWNPIAMRCTPVSEGCANCWHLAMAKRMAGNPSLGDERRAAYAGGSPVLVESEIDAPLRRKKPARIGVQFMGDLGHPSITDRVIACVWNTMACATLECGRRHEHTIECWTGSPHQYLVLTKRPERLRRVLTQNIPYLVSETWSGDSPLSVALEVAWPLPNVWLGVTAENQQRADERIPILLQIPAAGHFVSLEPLLGAVDLEAWVSPSHVETELHPFPDEDGNIVPMPVPVLIGDPSHLDWVIAGGESGPGARPMHPDWARSVRDQCQESGTPFLFKQHGAWYPNDQRYPGFAEIYKSQGDARHTFINDMAFARVGKRAAGRLLDGELWDEYLEGICQQ